MESGRIHLYTIPRREVPFRHTVRAMSAAEVWSLRARLLLIREGHDREDVEDAVGEARRLDPHLIEPMLIGHFVLGAPAADYAADIGEATVRAPQSALGWALRALSAEGADRAHVGDYLRRGQRAFGKRGFSYALHAKVMLAGGDVAGAASLAREAIRHWERDRPTLYMASKVLRAVGDCDAVARTRRMATWDHHGPKELPSHLTEPCPMTREAAE